MDSVVTGGLAILALIIGIVAGYKPDSFPHARRAGSPYSSEIRRRFRRRQI